MRYLIFSIFILMNIQCASDSAADTYQLSPNQVGFQIGEQAFKPKNINGSFILQEPKNRFSFTALDGSEGILVLINTPNDNLEGTYSIGKDSGNSIKLNQKEKNGLNVYVAERCKSSRGQIIITAHDIEQKTVSGYFDAMLCSSLLVKGGTKIIQDGKFEQVKYYETIKK